MEYEVYILRCENNSVYTGIAKNTFERFEKHKIGKGAKYTRMHKPIKIELIFLCKDKSEASKVEAYIKTKSKNEKEKYIKSPFILEEDILKIFEIKILQKI